jgi:DinB superfamily
MSSRIDALADRAPDVVAIWRALDTTSFESVAGLVAAAGGPGSAPRVVPQLAAVAAAFGEIVEELPDAAFTMPGGEGEWNVAQVIGHAADARAGLVLAGSLAASGRWSADLPRVTPGIPGSAVATREQLLRRIAGSQRVIERAAGTIEGHETDPCPLDHPFTGRLRCGEWLLFSGVHDLLHLEQLEQLGRAMWLDRLAPSEAPG